MSPLDRSAPPAPGSVRPFRFPTFERRELEGGLTLFIAPSSAVPLIFFELLSPGGAHLDPAGRAGLAALTGAMLDEGTPGKSSRQIAAAAERVGGYLATGTDWSCTSVSTGLMSAHAESGLSLIGEIVREPTLPDDELERLRERTLSEIRRRRVVPSALASLQFARALYGRGVYGEPVLGTSASVEAITRSDVKAFYRDRIVAAPLRLVVAGDCKPQAIERLAQSALVGLPRRQLEPAPSAAPPEQASTRVFLVDRPGSTQTELRIGHVGVARAHPDFTALSVMNSLLGGKFTSRLNLNLRERHGFTYGVRSGFSHRLGPGPFTISSAVATESAGRAVAEVRAELERLRDQPVPAEELDETRSYILGVFPYTVQSLEGVSHRLRALALHDLPLDYWDRYPAEIGAVSAGDIQRVAQAHLRPERLTIVAVGPEAELRPQLEPFGELEICRPSEHPELT